VELFSKSIIEINFDEYSEEIPVPSGGEGSGMIWCCA